MSVTSWNVHESPGPPARRLRGTSTLRPISIVAGRRRVKCDSMRRGRPPSSSGARAPDGVLGDAGALPRSAVRRPTPTSRPVIALGRAVERQDPALRVRGRQPARQAVDHVLIERLQVGDLRRTPARAARRSTVTPSASDPLSSATAKNPNALSSVRCTARPTAAAAPATPARVVHVAGGREVLRQHHAAAYSTALSVATSSPPRRNCTHRRRRRSAARRATRSSW